MTHAIPESKLVELIAASNKMLEVVAYRDRKKALDTIVELGHDLLKAESCAVFWADEYNDNMQPVNLRLDAFHADLKGEEPDALEFPIVSKAGGGISAHAAFTKELLRLNAEELDRTPQIKNRNAPYLASKHCYSTLIVPLIDKIGLLGILKVDNKKGENGAPGPSVEFTEVDEAIITWFSKTVVNVLENLRVHWVLDDFLKDMQDPRLRDAMPPLIGQWAKDLLRANRSELALEKKYRRKASFGMCGMMRVKTSEYYAM